MPIPDSPEFRSTRGIGLILNTVMGLSFLLLFVSLASNYMEHELIGRIIQGDFTQAEAEWNDQRQFLIAMPQIGLAIVAGILYCIWKYRAHRNLTSLGAWGLQYTPGWAVGSYFVPFLNLYRPLQILNEIWHASDPAGFEYDQQRGGPTARSQSSIPMFLLLWWIVRLIDLLVVQRILLKLLMKNTPDLESLQTTSMINIVSDVLELFCYVPIMIAVHQISVWQDERSELARTWSGSGSPDAREAAPMAWDDGLLDTDS